MCDHCQGDCYRPCTNNAGANYSTTVVSTIPSAFDHSAASVVAVHVKREVQIHPPVKASSVFPVMLGAGNGPPAKSPVGCESRLIRYDFRLRGLDMLPLYRGHGKSWQRQRGKQS